jgi:hypothetical protein
MSTITINKKDIENLIGYVHTLLDFIDVDDFEDEDDKDLVNDGYDRFVKPIINSIVK